MNHGLSFIVPVYNGETTLKECLDSILAQDLTIAFEVIVVNNASTDETSKILETYSQVKVLNATDIRNRGRARNIGARMAKFPVIAFVDCDAIISKDWASTLIKALRRPFAAVQTPILIKYKRKEVENYYLDSKSFIQTMDSCSLMIMKEAFFDVGGFEESLSRWEDAHLTMKLLSLGHGLLVTSKAKVIKYENRNSFELYKRIFEHGRAEGIAYKAWFQATPLGLKKFLNLKYHPSFLAGLIQLIGQKTARRIKFPELKLKGGWTSINANLVISKYLNVLVSPDFICIKSITNNVIHSIDKHHPAFARLLKKATQGDDFWDDLLLEIPEDPLILRRNAK